MSPTDHRRAEEAVDRLLDELPLLSEYETLIMAQLWANEDDEARRRAWQRAKPAIRRTGLDDLLNKARDEVATWMRASQADFAGLAGLLGREGGHVSARQSAAPAVIDAIAATLAERELHSADHDLLLRPWQRALEAGQQATDESAGPEQASD